MHTIAQDCMQVCRAQGDGRGDASALYPLEAASGFGATRLLTLYHPRIPSQQPRCLERWAVFRVEQLKRPRNPMA